MKIARLNEKYNAVIHYVDCEKFDMSSTMARGGMIKDNEYIDEDVYKYILKKGLYDT